MKNVGSFAGGEACAQSRKAYASPFHLRYLNSLSRAAGFDKTFSAKWVGTGIQVY